MNGSGQEIVKLFLRKPLAKSTAQFSVIAFFEFE
jgi:hypothetical protein